MKTPSNLNQCEQCGRWYCADACPTCSPDTLLASPIGGSAPSKYRNVPTEVDGIRFASKREAERWGELKMMEVAGVITDLQRQVPFQLTVNGQTVTTYVADFTYLEGGVYVVEDVKSKATKTTTYRIKKRLMWACKGIEIKEVF